MSELNAKSSNSKKWLYLAPLMVFGAMTVLLYSGLGKDPTKLESQLIGKPIPKFERSSLLDENIRLSHDNLKGPALLNVFGSWCPSCYTEHPYLMKLAASKETKIYGLNYKDKRKGGLKFINDLGNPYDFIVFDEKGRLGIDLGVYGAPETFVIDSNHQIVYRHVGVVTDQVWQQILKPKMFHSEKQSGSGNK